MWWRRRICGDLGRGSSCHRIIGCLCRSYNIRTESEAASAFESTGTAVLEDIAMGSAVPATIAAEITTTQSLEAPPGILYRIRIEELGPRFQVV